MVKSKQAESHPENLKETLKRYGMKLNPSKCCFGIHEGVFLGFYIGQEEIGLNLKKVEAILNTVPLRIIRKCTKIKLED